MGHENIGRGFPVCLSAEKPAFASAEMISFPVSAFNHDQSIERIVYAVLSRLNEQWGKKPLKEFTQKD